jgi:hypothetical protein
MQLRTGLYSNAQNKLNSSSKKRGILCDIWGSHGGYEFKLSSTLRRLCSHLPGKYKDMPQRWRRGQQVLFNFCTNLHDVTSHKIIKVKSEVSPVYAMKVYIGSRGTAPLILNFATKWMWMVNFKAPVTLTPGKHLRYPLHDRLGGPQRGEIDAENIRRSCQCRDSNTRSSSPQPTYSTAVFPNLFEVAVSLTSLFIYHGTPWGKRYI